MKERIEIQKCRYLRNLLHYDTAKSYITMMSNLNSTYISATHNIIWCFTQQQFIIFTKKICFSLILVVCYLGMNYFPIPSLVDKHVNHEEAFDVNIVTDPVCLYQGHLQGKITVKSLKVKPPLMICILIFSTSKIFFINIFFPPGDLLSNLPV